MIYEPWFALSEYKTRLENVQKELIFQGLDALIAFQPETVTWLTGFFTRGYGSFQFALIPSKGEPKVICRDVEEYYLDKTSIYNDRAMWSDREDPIEVSARAIQSRLGVSGKVGIELTAWPLTVSRYMHLSELLSDFQFVDASNIVKNLRLIKSTAEIAFQKKAGLAAEAGMQAAIDTVGEGVSEREVAAEVCAAMVRAGSDLPGPGVMSSGERAFHLHGGYSDRVLKSGDIVQIETTPNVRHYHARFMRPILVDRATEEQQKVVDTLISVQDKALSEVGPGIAAKIPDKIYRDGILSHGLRKTYTNKTFYSVGLLLQPSGGEALEATKDCSWRFESGMTFHTYVLAKGFGMSETIAITETGHEKLTSFPRQLFLGRQS